MARKPRQAELKARTLELINQEYANCSAICGDKAYRIEKMKEEVKDQQARMFELNQEAAALQAKSPPAGR